MDPALLPALYDAMIVARTGSVGVAAKRLHKTPSAVSQQLRRLTESLGVPLFERRGRGLVLTQAATHVLPAATRLFDEAESVFRLFGEMTGSAATTLRIAASDYLGKPLLVPVLRDLALEGAPLHFEISTVHSEEALTLLERGEVEMAIVSFSGERVGLTSTRLFEQPFFWVGPKPQRKAGKAQKLTQRLEREPLLRLAAGSLGRRLSDELLERHGLRPASIIDVPSVSLLLAYATGGVGIGLAPALPIEPRDLERASIEPAGIPALPVQLMVRAGRRPVPAVQRFVERLLKEAERQRARLQQLAGKK